MPRDGTPLIIESAGSTADVTEDAPPTQDDPEETLKDVFGFPRFREGQEEIVARLLEGTSVVAVFPPSGSGQSLPHQLTALLVDGPALVVSPLNLLSRRKVEFLRGRDIPAARLDSSMNRAETRQVYDDLGAGRLKVLYVSHRRTRNEQFLEALAKTRLGLLVVDEAHYTSELSPNYAPDYAKVARLAREWGAPCVLAVTTSATPEVAGDIAERFAVASDAIVHVPFNQSNLKLAVAPCAKDEGLKILAERLREHPRRPTIVFVWNRQIAENVAEVLRSEHIEAQAYHGEMSLEERESVEEAFGASSTSLVAATRAFGMAAERPDIRYVYHYGLPASLEHYWRDLGVAGRDGKESICEVIACRDDVVALENGVYGGTPTQDAVASLMDDLFGRGDILDVMSHGLAQTHDVRQDHVDIILTCLEQEGYIEWDGPYFSRYGIRRKKTLPAILDQFDGLEAEFLEGLFEHAPEVDGWHTLDIVEAAKKMGEAPERFVKAVTHLSEAGLVRLRGSEVRVRYRLKRQPEDLKALEDTFSQRFERRATSALHRIRQVVDYVEQPACLLQTLRKHIGETSRPCGQCSSCEDGAREAMPAAEGTPPGDDHVGPVRKLRSRKLAALATSRQLTRFLCGIPSPASSRDDLRGHPLYGAFKDIPFQDVAALVEKTKEAPF